MDYIKIRFSDDVSHLHSSYEKSLEDMFRSVNPMFSLDQRTWKPPIDIYETPVEIILRAELAGVEKENLEVEISRRAIKISGKRSQPAHLKNATYRLAEIQYGIFERILYLPVFIDTEKVSTAYSHGFLEIRLAKGESEKVYKVHVSDG